MNSIVLSTTPYTVGSTYDYNRGTWGRDGFLAQMPI